MNWTNFTQVEPHRNNTEYSQPNEIISSLTEFLYVIDTISRVLAFLSHSLYFGFVLFVKQMHMKGLLYLHHVNLLNYVYILMFIFYIANFTPSFSDPKLNELLCTLSEITWGLLKYLQSYSVILLSVYRVIACYKPILFKKINRIYLLLLPMGFVWLLAVLLFLLSKYIFNTTYGSIYCIDGYSSNTDEILNHFIWASILSTILPFILVLAIFITIYKKMTEHDVNSTHDFHWHHHHLTHQKKNKLDGAHHDHFHHSTTQTHQLFFINICYLISFSTSFVLDLRYLLDFSHGYLYVIRLVFRISGIISFAFMPIISLYYIPFIHKKFKRKPSGSNKVASSTFIILTKESN